MEARVIIVVVMVEVEVDYTAVMDPLRRIFPYRLKLQEKLVMNIIHNMGNRIHAIPRDYRLIIR